MSAKQKVYNKIIEKLQYERKMGNVIPSRPDEVEQLKAYREGIDAAIEIIKTTFWNNNAFD